MSEKTYQSSEIRSLIGFAVSISRLEREISHLESNLDQQIAISGLLPLNFSSLPQDLKTKLLNVKRHYEAKERSIEYYQEKFPELNGLIKCTQNLYSHLETIVQIPSE